MISYVTGDATAPAVDGNKIIVHICNDVGAWGAGFVLALSARWPGPEREYRAWHRGGGAVLGAVQFVQVAPDTWVANVVGQHGIGRHNGPPIRYDAVRRGLEAVAVKARELGASVHMPRIGCGLAGGRWSEMEEVVREALEGVEVTVYDFGR